MVNSNYPYSHWGGKKKLAAAQKSTSCSVHASNMNIPLFPQHSTINKQKHQNPLYIFIITNNKLKVFVSQTNYTKQKQPQTRRTFGINSALSHHLCSFMVGQGLELVHVLQNTSCPSRFFN